MLLANAAGWGDAVAEEGQEEEEGSMHNTVGMPAEEEEEED